MSSAPVAGTARKIAAQMTGMEFDAIDDTVKDGIGEICNMLAGAWKGKVPELAANCGLSVPAVITGRDYNLHVQAPEFQIHHVLPLRRWATLKSPSSATACNSPAQLRSRAKGCQNPARFRRIPPARYPRLDSDDRS